MRATVQTALIPSAQPSQLPDLVRTDPLRLAASMLEAVLNKGVTAENVSAVKELVGLVEHMQEKSAEQQFNAAFVNLQKEMPRIQATKAVPNNDGSVRYTYAPFEEIMAQAQPHLVANGFTVSFSMRYDGVRIIEICTLRHAAGHSVSNEFAVRTGSGPPKATETQADGAAATYAKRGALCNALNIVVRGQDNDARIEGASITPDQAKILRARVMATGSDEQAFLKFAQAPVPSDNATVQEIEAAYLKIPSVMMPTLNKNLERKEKTR